MEYEESAKALVDFYEKSIEKAGEDPWGDIALSTTANSMSKFTEMVTHSLENKGATDEVTLAILELMANTFLILAAGCDTTFEKLIASMGEDVTSRPVGL